MSDQIAKNFEELVELNFQLYSNLFLTIPMDKVVKTGMLIPLLRDECEKGLAAGVDPVTIINEFLEKNDPGLEDRQKIDFLFRVVQYVERQILLIDALEDAAYKKIHRIEGPNTLPQFLQRIKDDHLEWKLKHFISNFGIRVVLTAHPTQFYPGQVLAIGSDLTTAISSKDSSEVRDLMHQLSKTPFFRKQKPTPYNEAVRLSWYLSNIFYPAVGEIIDNLTEDYPDEVDENPNLISLGFWPGGDRDGNPFVKADTTIKVASLLRSSILSCYLEDLKNLKRRLSFVGVFDRLENLEELLMQQLNNTSEHVLDLEEVNRILIEIERTIIEKHNNLFVTLIQSFRRKISFFGYYFASLDIRQDSRIINKALNDVLSLQPGLVESGFDELDVDSKISALLNIKGSITQAQYEDELTNDTLASMRAMQEIQRNNGERGCNRYIISNCRGASDIAKVLALMKISGWEEPNADIVPLFETIEDLHHAGNAVRELYNNTHYREHLRQRNNKQTIMLGFSDGTKDGGYLAANWSIFIAKEEISKISRESDIQVIFFDGRGGPPARGGGNTHLFYSALGSRIESKEIQLTLQGQTISSHYGLKESAYHNLGYLLTAGLSNNVYSQPDKDLTDNERVLMFEMSDTGFRKYEDFKNHPLFIPFLQERSTLKYYGMANISSRPSKRGNDDKLDLDSLRAIPFVGAWSQLKQNVPGFFGLGTALKEQEEKGNLQQCTEFYKRSPFFRALISNSMQSIMKSNFALTRYMEKDEKYGPFWRIIFDEFELTRAMLLKVSGMVVLLEDNSRSRKSIKLRENVVLPLLVIQQYALMKIHQNQDEHTEIFEKLVMRSLFGNINAMRNAV